MADISFIRDPWPVAPAFFEGRTDLGVKAGVGAHGASVAKFCDMSKQHFAGLFSQSSAMGKLTANQILAKNLDHLMTAQGWSNLALGKKAGVAANTIANYRKQDSDVTSTGKERSAKLVEVERLAQALGVTLINLLTDAEQAEEDPKPATLARKPLDFATIAKSLIAEYRDPRLKRVAAQLIEDAERKVHEMTASYEEAAKEAREDHSPHQV